MAGFGCPPRVASAVNFAHASSADRRNDFVGTKLSPTDRGIRVNQLSLADQEALSARMTACTEVVSADSFVWNQNLGYDGLSNFGEAG